MVGDDIDNIPSHVCSELHSDIFLVPFFAAFCESYSDQEGLPNTSFLFNKHKAATKRGFVPIYNLLIIADPAKARWCTPSAGFTSAAG